MEKLRIIIKMFANDERGTETVEWAILAGMLVLAATAVWMTIGGNISSRISTLAEKLVNGQ